MAYKKSYDHSFFSSLFIAGKGFSCERRGSLSLCYCICMVTYIHAWKTWWDFKQSINRTVANTRWPFLHNLVDILDWVAKLPVLSLFEYVCKIIIVIPIAWRNWPQHCYYMHFDCYIGTLWRYINLVIKVYWTDIGEYSHRLAVKCTSLLVPYQ